MAVAVDVTKSPTVRRFAGIGQPKSPNPSTDVVQIKVLPSPNPDSSGAALKTSTWHPMHAVPCTRDVVALSITGQSTEAPTQVGPAAPQSIPRPPLSKIASLSGGSVQRIRKSIQALRETLPSIRRPLSQLILVATGDVVLVFREGAAFEAVSGQEWVFEVAEFQREVEAWRAAAESGPRRQRVARVRSRRAKERSETA